MKKEHADACAPFSLFKLASQSIKELIANVSGFGAASEHKMEDFVTYLANYNKNNVAGYKCVKEFVLTLNKSGHEVTLVSADVVPAEHSLPAAQIINDLKPLIDNLAKTIPAYFSKYGKDLGLSEPDGQVVCNYEIQQPAPAGIANPYAR